MAKWRVNVLCIVGAFMGLVAIFCGWGAHAYTPGAPQENLLQIIDHMLNIHILAGCVLFLIGSLIAFLSPMGGIVQLIGVGLFIFGWTSWPDGVGPYLGIISAFILVISMVKPIGLNYKGPTDLKGRLLTFSMSR